MRRAVSDLVDDALDASIVPGFTSIGYDVRRVTQNWKQLREYDLDGRVVLLTGATSGIGRAAAIRLAKCGAELLLVGRDTERNEAAVADIIAASGNGSVTQYAADMGDLSQVRSLAQHVMGTRVGLDVLVHNAGALANERREAPDGTEATVASQVVGPFLLTSMLLGHLGEAAPSRVITMSSGGMYTEGLTVDGLQMAPDDYRGAIQYARAKRAQVTMNELWAQRFGHLGIHFHSLHPGWADTPGVDASLPTFAKVMGPLLRTAGQGADTLVWLAADDEAIKSNGLFWHDRRARDPHRLRSTRVADTLQRREQLWEWVSDTAGVNPSPVDLPATDG